MVRPRVTPPLRAFFRLSFTSVSSSSRFTRSSSFSLHSSSNFFRRSDSEICERLPNVRERRNITLLNSSFNDKHVSIFLSYQPLPPQQHEGLSSPSSAGSGGFWFPASSSSSLPPLLAVAWHQPPHGSSHTYTGPHLYKKSRVSKS